MDKKTIPLSQVKRNKKEKKGVKILGPVENLENYVHPEWWRNIFNSWWL